MSRRVLLAEQNDTIRGVAETVLRQNGFDVISVNNPDKLFEILELSVPDLFLVDANLCGNEGQPTHHKLRQNARASQVPLMLLADEYHESLGLPASAVVLRPFDPANVLSQITQVMGSQPDSSHQTSPFAEGSLDDEFLDSALGLDHLEVTDSEDMNKTGFKIPVSRDDNTKIMGIGQFEKTAPVPDDSSKIESLMISDSDSDIKSSTKPGTPESDSFNETSGLQLSDDQYGLTDPDSLQADNDVGDHDYNWFVNSMKTDSDNSSGGFGTPPPSKAGSSNLEFTDSSNLLDPVTPGPASTPPPAQSPPSQPVASVDQSSGGMDKFIDEFRQEAEKLGESGPESIVIPQESPVAPQVDQQVNPEAGFSDSDVMVQSISEKEQASWEDKIENITPEHLRIFSRELASRLADKIAGLILARIDQDKLLRLIKDELVEEVRKKS